MFNPDKSCLFLYTTSAGNICVCDVRERSDFSRKPTLSFSVPQASDRRTDMFSKYLDYVSRAHFINGAQQIVSRDYCNMKMWDVRLASSTVSTPVYSAQVTDYMDRNLRTLYE